MPLLRGTKTLKGSEMVYVKGGTFTMGCTSEQTDCGGDEKPAHEVTISGFYMSKHEITNQQFAKFLNEKGNQEEGDVEWINLEGKWGNTKCRIIKQGNTFKAEPDYENHPVVYVSWYGAKAYCEWAGGRLPTEAEWEFAARGGNNSKGYKYAGSNNIDNVAWYVVNSYDKGEGHSDFGNHAVGTKRPNELEIYDMTGNVWEWCSDWYASDYYKTSPGKNPQGPDTGADRVCRGGGWGDEAQYCRVAYRSNGGPGGRSSFIGFRLVSVP